MTIEATGHASYIVSAERRIPGSRSGSRFWDRRLDRKRSLLRRGKRSVIGLVYNADLKTLIANYAWRVVSGILALAFIPVYVNKLGIERMA